MNNLRLWRVLTVIGIAATVWMWRAFDDADSRLQRCRMQNSELDSLFARACTASALTPPCGEATARWCQQR